MLLVLKPRAQLFLFFARRKTFLYSLQQRIFVVHGAVMRAKFALLLRNMLQDFVIHITAPLVKALYLGVAHVYPRKTWMTNLGRDSDVILRLQTYTGTVLCI